MVLQSVKVYASGGANRTIELRDASNNVLESVTAFVPNGESRVNVNMIVQPGQDLRLGLASGTFADLYRNNSGVNYPYSVNGFVDINGSSAGSSYYYFFYDWEVHSLADTCISALRTPVIATVGTVGIGENIDNTGITVYPNPSDGHINIKFLNGISDHSTLSIYDMSGRIVYSSELSKSIAPNEELNLNLPGIDAGVYSLQIANDKGIIQKSFSVL